MKRWIKYTASSVLAGCLCLGGYTYWKLEPNHHFEQMNVPVLAKPGEAAAGTPTSDSLNSPQPEETPNLEQKKEIKAFNVLILGIDARGEESSRSDVMMVMHVIPSERKANIVSLPRDTRVNIKGVGNTKINHAHILGEIKGGNQAGTQLALQTVSDFLKEPINFYLKTDFKGFEDFINTIGGVDVEVKKDIYLFHAKTTLSKGKQHIDGKLALSLARERYAFPDGDFGRQSEQSEILRNVAQEVLKPDHMTEIASLLTRVKKDILDTNFTESDIISLAWLFKGMTSDDFQYKQIPGHSDYEMDPIVQLRLYYWIPDMEQVKSISEKYLQ